MQVGYLQFDPQTRTTSDNISYVLKKCRSQSNSLIVLPELSFSSYYDHTPFTLQSLRSALIPLIQLSKRNKLTFIGSVVITFKSVTQNRIFIVQLGKLTLGHAKHKLFAQEKMKLVPGRSPFTIIDYDGITIGTCICLDILDAVSIRKMVNHGIDILLTPSTVSMNYLLSIAKARSLENQIITIFTNRSGKENNNIIYLGRSTIFYPDGKCTPPTKRNRLKTVEVTDTDFKKMRAMRKYLGIII